MIGSRSAFEQPAYELDLALDAWQLVMDVASLNGPDCCALEAAGVRWSLPNAGE